MANGAIAEPEAILLWPKGAPGSADKQSAETVRINEYGEHIVSNVHFPSITPYLPAPDHSTRAAVVVVPGGGHRELWMDHEGYSVARYLAEHGVAAFVLKYRLAREAGVDPTPSKAARSSICSARFAWCGAGQPSGSLIRRRVGVMGFSAGGELAALAGTHYDPGAPDSKDAVERFEFEAHIRRRSSIRLCRSTMQLNGGHAVDVPAVRCGRSARNLARSWLSSISRCGAPVFLRSCTSTPASAMGSVCVRTTHGSGCSLAAAVSAVARRARTHGNVGKRIRARASLERKAGPRHGPAGFQLWRGLAQNLKATSRRYDRP